MDVTGEDTWRWNFFDAYPVKWTGPDFRAETNAIAFETVALAHHGIRKG
jgi:phage tail-like protein